MASSDDDGGSDSERDMDDEVEQDEDGGEFVEGAGMSEAEERLVASFMNAGEERPILALFGKPERGYCTRGDRVVSPTRGMLQETTPIC